MNLISQEEDVQNVNEEIMKLESEEATIKAKLETQEAAVKEAEGGFKLSENRKLEILEASQKHQVKYTVLRFCYYIQTL